MHLKSYHDIGWTEARMEVSVIQDIKRESKNRRICYLGQKKRDETEIEGLLSKSERR